MFSYEVQKRTSSRMKCRSMHTYFWMSFPFASPCSLKGEIRAEVTGDRFNFVRAGIKRQPSLAAALFRLHWCWCCCWCKKVPGRQHQPAGEEEEVGPDLVSDRSQALAGLARPGARSNRGLVLRNATLSCSAARGKFCATVPPCSERWYTFLPAV